MVVGTQLLDRDVLPRGLVVFGDALVDDDLALVLFGEWPGGLDRPSQRAGDDRLDRLVGEISGQRQRLLAAVGRQLRVRPNRPPPRPR